MQAPRNARSSSRRSTGRTESRRRYSCMATRTVRRASARAESVFEGVWGASVISRQDYTKQALSPTNSAPIFDLRRTRKSHSARPRFEDRSHRNLCAVAASTRIAFAPQTGRGFAGVSSAAPRIDLSRPLYWMFHPLCRISMPGSPAGCAHLRADSALSLEALGAPLRRQPLDDLAGRARRDQPHRGGARKDRHRPRRHPRLAVRRRRRAAEPGVARRAIAPRWKDPQSGYVRRNISPPNFPSPIRIVEVSFPAGRAGVLRNRRARLGRRAADLGARGRDRSHRRQGHAQAGQGRLPRHAARRAGDVSQSHAQDGALHRGVGRHERLHGATAGGADARANSAGCARCSSIASKAARR